MANIILPPGEPLQPITVEVLHSNSLVPRPYEGEERAWYTLLAHAPGAPEKCGAPDTIVYLVASYTMHIPYTLEVKHLARDLYVV